MINHRHYLLLCDLGQIMLRICDAKNWLIMRIASHRIKLITVTILLHDYRINQLKNISSGIIYKYQPSIEHLFANK